MKKERKRWMSVRVVGMGPYEAVELPSQREFMTTGCIPDK